MDFENKVDSFNFNTSISEVWEYDISKNSTHTQDNTNDKYISTLTKSSLKKMSVY